MKNVLIVGASGMIGGIILQEALNDKDIKSVCSITRKTHGIQNPKLKEILHSDFSNYSGIEHAFNNIDAAYFCIGVYTGAVKDDLFKIITVDFAKVFADAVIEKSPSASFNFLSGAGADLEEKSRMSFARYKGMAENYIISKNFSSLNIFRPGYIYPVDKREEPNFSYRLFRIMYPVVNFLMPSSSVTSEELAKAMFNAGKEKLNKGILENIEIKRM